MDATTREWLDEKFAALTQRLVAQDRTLERVERQTTLTNGRVGKLEQAVAGVLPRIEGHDRELRDLNRNAPIDTNQLVQQLRAVVSNVETGQERVVRIWMLGAIVVIVGLAFAVAGSLGMLKKPSDVVVSPPAVVR
jgi:hypothetical protein